MVSLFFSEVVPTVRKVLIPRLSVLIPRLSVLIPRLSALIPRLSSHVQ